MILYSLLFTLACRNETEKTNLQDSDGDGFSTAIGDCDDTDASVNPEAEEICDGVDNNCDENIDEAGGQMFYPDADEDGFGVSEEGMHSCEESLAGMVLIDGDCNDEDALVHPDASELCDGVDNNCDEEIDEATAEDATDWYLDEDGDGFGQSERIETACTAPDGYAAEPFDCDDTRAEINPEAPEIPNDEIDQDCSGSDDQAKTVSELEVGDLLFSEVMADPASVDDFKGEWFEIYNASSDPVDMFGLVIGDGDSSFTVDTHLVVLRGGYSLFALRDDALQNGGLTEIDFVYSRDAVRMDNVSTLRIASDEGLVIDSLSYTVGEFPIQEGVSMVNGQLLEGADTGSYWCFGTSTYGDGDLGTPGSVNDPCDLDEDGFTPVDGDCDDLTATVYPNANEVCDGLDNDCDSLVDLLDDDLDGVIMYADTDSDGYGDAGASLEVCDALEGYVLDDSDCDDSNADISPLAEEVCDALDNDCDALIDDDDDSVSAEGMWYADTDADGYGDPITMVLACTVPTGFVSDNTDCDDTSASLSPETIWYTDADGDDFGDVNSFLITCEAPSNGVLNDVDCDDTRSDVFPNAVEVCDAVDNSCNGLVDDADSALDASTTSTFYLDSDSDGFGDVNNSTTACVAPSGYVADNSDCVDSDETSFPEAAERCDGFDNDCDTFVDEDVSSTWFADTDGDGFGDLNSTLEDCNPPTGYVSDNTDCDDTSELVYPEAEEICDTLDNDCDSLIDDDDEIVGGTTFYLDADEDGFGDTNAPMNFCVQPAGYVSDTSDCDDGDTMVFVGQREECDDNVDNNCDGILNSALCDYEFSTLAGDGVSIEYDSNKGTSIYNTNLGFSLSALGDVSGDSVVDFAVAARFSDDGGGTDSGSTYIFFGPLLSDTTSSAADVILNGAAGEAAGHEISGGNPVLNIGSDENNDGTGDVLVSAIWADSKKGAVYLAHGPFSADVDLSTSSASRLVGEIANDQLGKGAVSFVSDVNNDGFDDYLVGTHRNDNNGTNSGSAYLVLGGSATSGVITDAAHLSFYGTIDDQLGYAVAPAGDVNGDGLADVLINANRFDVTDSDGNFYANAGRTYLFLGSANPTWDLAQADATLDGAGADDKSGNVLDTVGDIDGDGNDDFVLGAAVANYDGAVDSGAAYLFTQDLSGAHSVSEATATFYPEEWNGNRGDTHLGRSITGAGDLNQDGVLDIAIGAKLSDRNGVDSGAVFLYYGPLSGTYTAAHGVASGAFSGDETGISIDVLGDIDGNGGVDLLIGADKHNSASGKAYVLFSESMNGL
jgi:hypothetical protein